jgi:hypothetical protein
MALVIVGVIGRAEGIARIVVLERRVPGLADPGGRLCFG